MNITLNGTKITQDTRNLAFEKNSGVDEIVITVDTDESWSYKLDVKYPDKYNVENNALYNIIDLDRNGNTCSVTLNSEMLPFNGKYTMQLRGVNGDKVYHSDTFEVWVKYSIEPGSTYDPVPSEFYQVEARLDDKVDEVKQYAENAVTASTRMPKISPDNTWLIWDVGTGDYVDTGVKASGSNVDAKAREDISKLSEEKANKIDTPVSAEVDKNNLVSFKNCAGKVLFTLQLFNGGGSTEGESSLSPFSSVNWLDTVYAVGENANYEYNGWCPNTVAYDNQSGKIVFMQTHGPAHSSGVKNKTLVTIDPYDPTVYEKVEAFPAFTSGDGVGGLVVEDGVWTVYGMKKRCRSTDFGSTWDIANVVTPPACMYGVCKIDGVLYCGDDYSTTDAAHNGYYYVSNDDGITWEQRVFDFAGDYEIPCSEASFAKWKGELYASIRREDNTGLLAKQVDGVWTVIYDQLPNVSSDSSLLPFDNLIAISSIDRPNCKLILSTWDGKTLTVQQEYDFTGITASGDFHTPTYICGEDWQAVFFMTNGHGNIAYYSAMNAAIFGYADGVKANTPTYEVERVEDFTWADLSSEPAYHCTPVVDETGVTINPTDTTKTPWLNSAKRLNNSYPPDENGNIYYYGFTNAGTVPTHVPTNRYGFAYSYLDTKQVGDRMYICVVAKGNPMADLSGVKMMGVANKIIISDSDMTGATYCVTGNAFAGASTYGNGWFNNKPYRVKQE